MLARGSRGVHAVVLQLARLADKPRGPTWPHKRLALAARLMVRACDAPRGRAVLSRRAVRSPCPRAAACDLCVCDHRIQTMALRLRARVALSQALG